MYICRNGGVKISTVGIVALSLLAGLFIAMLIATSAWLVWQGYQFKKIVIETRSTLATHRQEWANNLSQLSVTLESHRTEINHAIAKINGDQLSKAVQLFSQLVQEQRSSAQRIERAAIAVGTFTQQWLAEGALGGANESAANSSSPGVTPDGFAAAEPGERFVLRSRTATDDASVLEEESADVTTPEQP